MQLSLPGSPHLTYCTNIHAGERWHEIDAALRRHIPSIKSRVSPDKPMGVGLRMSGPASEDLYDPTAIAELQAFLRDEDLYVFTVNAFPYGAFHGKRVKEQVYEPDWRDEERLRYTNRTADILARLLPEGIDGSVSTVPGAFRANVRGEADVTRIAEVLTRHAAYLHAIARETGKCIGLALEPEPCCFLETIDDAVTFFDDYLFSRRSIEVFRCLTGLPASWAEEALRRHLGICLDVCHSAVEFEDPAESVARLESAGIRVAKIQLSSALRISAADGDTAELLQPFDDGVYLHQTVATNDGKLTRYPDLPEAIAALRNGAAAGEWRVHCHVPLFQSSFGALQSTQQSLADLLAVCRQRALAPHLEVETYTWDVLPQHMRDGDVGSDIARELTWVRSQLGA
jgi:sugar phosphate isomerase/epimerase